jgi:lipopolysaccharide exporter
LSLARNTLKGVLWAYASFFSGKMLTMITTVILARLLLVEDFGLIAFAIVVLNFVDATRNFGVMEALIYNTEREEDASDTAFIINFLIGLGQFAVTFLLAPLAVHFIKDPRIIDVIRIMSLAFIFNGLGDTHDALLQKDLKFNRRFAPDLFSALIKGVISVVMAAAGFGIWSLVVGYIVGSVARMVASWVVLSIALGQVAPVVVGTVLGALELGYYSIASKIPELIVINISLVLTKVIFPTYVKIKDDRELLIRGYFKTTKFTVFITAAAGFGMAAVAPEMVPIIFGKQWIPAVPLVQVLAVLGTASTLAWNAGDVFKAIGRPDISTKLMLAETTYTFALVIGFAAASGTALMTAVGNLIAVCIGALIRLVLIGRFLKFNPLEFVSVFRAPALGGVVMFLAVTAWRSAVSSWTNMAILVSSVLLGALIYCAILWVLESKEVIQIFKIFTSVLRRNNVQSPDLKISSAVAGSPIKPEA